MTTDEYVPSDEEMLSAYVTGRMMRDGLMRTEAEQEFRCGLARVRRDAAREALDGLADDFDMWHQDMHTDEVARRIRHEMKLLHPEEETP